MWIVPLSLAIILHEVAHGWVALKLGDTTARDMGRLTLNPISHIDPIGTIVVPVLLMISPAGFVFGWAKPVPVLVHRLRNPRKDLIWVALAGPGANLLMAIGWVLFAKLTSNLVDPGTTSAMFLKGVVIRGVIINIALMIFNMLPLLPLDGGRVLHGLLPRELGDKFAVTERWGMFVIVGLLATGLFKYLTAPIYYVADILFRII